MILAQRLNGGRRFRHDALVDAATPENLLPFAIHFREVGRVPGRENHVLTKRGRSRDSPAEEAKRSGAIVFGTIFAH